jgi:hypothetical protein
MEVSRAHDTEFSNGLDLPERTSKDEVLQVSQILGSNQFLSTARKNMKESNDLKGNIEGGVVAA